MLKISLSKNEEMYQRGQACVSRENYSFLQSFDYGQMQARLGNEPLYLLLENENGDIVYSYLAILFKAKRGKYIFLPYAVFEAERLAIVTQFLQKLALEHGVDFIRISPLLADNTENLAQFGMLGFRPAPVHMMHPELLWLLDLAKDEKNLLMEMRKNTRYALKQAGKMPIRIISGSSEELLKNFYDIHLATARRQHFVPYPWEYLQAQLAVFGPKDQIKVYVAEYEGKFIAGAVIMFYGYEGVYHHGASLAEYNRVPASQLIQWEAIKEAKKRGLPRYNFWGVVNNAPKHPWAGLSFFKQGFGGSGQALLHCQDKPLTAKYWLNFLVETIRRIKRGY